MTENPPLHYWEDELAFCPDPLPYTTPPTGGRYLTCSTPTERESIQRILNVLMSRAWDLHQIERRL